jgi:hypothetical protein
VSSAKFELSRDASPFFDGSANDGRSFAETESHESELRFETHAAGVLM